MELMMESEELAVKPTQVVRMKKVVNGEKSNTAFFTVTFPPGTSLRQLENVKHHEATRGGFRPLAKSKGRRVCCGNCQQWDHFETGCRMAPRCRKCAGKHHSSVCQVVRPGEPRTGLKCANCGENYKFLTCS